MCRWRQRVAARLEGHLLLDLAAVRNDKDKFNQAVALCLFPLCDDMLMHNLMYFVCWICLLLSSEVSGVDLANGRLLAATFQSLFTCSQMIAITHIDGGKFSCDGPCHQNIASTLQVVANIPTSIAHEDVPSGPSAQYDSSSSPIPSFPLLMSCLVLPHQCAVPQDVGGPVFQNRVLNFLTSLKSK